MTTTDLASLIRTADLSDATDRAMLADALEDAGRVEEAELLRSGSPLQVRNNAVVVDAEAIRRTARMVAVAELERQVNAELSRLGVLASRNHPELLRAWAADSLPEGWVKIEDSSSAGVCGKAEEILDSLRSIHADPDSNDSVDTYELVWDVLGEFPDDAGNLDYDDNDEEIADTDICSECPNDDFSLYYRRTNGGLVWFAHPSDNDWLTANHNADFTHGHTTREEALAEAEQLQAEAEWLEEENEEEAE